MDDLLDLLKNTIVKKGSFRSSSGRELDHYVDVREGLLTSRTSYLIAQRFGQIIPKGTTKIVGKGLGARLLLGPLCLMYGLNGATVLDDKERVLHRETRSILGYVPTVNDRVLIVDDVSTTGGSLRATRNILQQTKTQIIGYAVVVKRGEIVLDAPLSYLFTDEQLLTA